MKRADLATPSGIDHDYNYLTSIEREFDKADREANSRGIFIVDNEGRKDGPAKGWVGLKAGLEKSEVIVARAPKGMSRSKNNNTKWLKGSQCLEWTVEWVHPDGRKELGQCGESLPILTAYRRLESEKAKRRVEAAANHGKAKKRKKSLVNGCSKKTEPSDDKTMDPTPAADANLRPRKKQNKRTMSHDYGVCNGENNTQDENPATEEAPSVDGLHVPSATGIHENLEVDSISTANPKTSDNANHIQKSRMLPEAKLSFYLHTPSLPSRNVVLAPIEPDATLSSVLPHRLVLEYPTIYVFTEIAEGKPPDGFITEEEYYRTARKEIIEELEEGEIANEGPSEAQDQGSEVGLGQVDERKLLEVLGKDLSGG